MGKVLSNEPPHVMLERDLKELHLSTIKESFAQVADGARKDSYSYEQFLLELTQGELDVRKQRRVERLLRESHLLFEKGLGQFDRKRLPAKVNQQ